MCLKKKWFDDSPLEVLHTQKNHLLFSGQPGEEKHHLVISFHHLVNENHFVFNSSASALGKPSFVDYNYDTLYFQTA